MSESEKGERESALKDDVTGVVEGVTTQCMKRKIIHRSQGCELRQVYFSSLSQFLLFMISVASALPLK